MSESKVGIPKPKVRHKVVSGGGFFCSPHALKINTNSSIQVSVVVAQIKETPGACHHGSANKQTGKLHVK